MKSCRASQAITLAAIKFMLLYNLVLPVALSVAYFMDGSTISHEQRGVLDFMALSLGLARSLRPASHRLTIQRPHQWLCMPRNFVIFTILVLVSAGMYAVFMWYLSIQPWFTGGNGSSHQNPIITSCWGLALGQVLAMPHMTFNVDALGFCEPFSLLELILVLVYVISATIIIFAGAAAVDVAGHFGFYQGEKG